MPSHETLILILEKEADSYSDGSYLSTLCLEACEAIRSLIRDKEALIYDKIALRCSNDGYVAQVKLLQKALELNGEKQAKKAKKASKKKKGA